MSVSEQTVNQQSSMLDKLGIWISSLCAVHCLVIPLLPILATTLVGAAWFERTILTASIIIGAVSLISSAVRHHGRYYPLAFLLLGATIYWFKDALGHDFEPVSVVIGAGLIVTSHLINIRLCRNCNHCQAGKKNLAGQSDTHTLCEAAK